MKLSLFSVFIFFASGCASPQKMSYVNLMPPREINDDFHKVLNKSEVKEDKMELEFALKNAYSGRKGLPENQFTNLLRNIDQIESPLEVSAFCDKVARAFDEVSDNHLKAFFIEKGEKYQTNCFEHDMRKAQVGKNYFQSKTSFWDVRLKKIKKSKALLISIKQFVNPKETRWSGFLDLVKAELPKAKFVILDLRGNGGGSDHMGGELAKIFAGANLKSPYHYPLWMSLTPESIQLWINAVTISDYFNEKLHLPKSNYSKAAVEEYTKELELAIQGKLTTIFPPEEDAENRSGVDFDLKKSIQKPIYILMDADCASSCESSIDLFEYNPLVKKVGENTAGYIHFGNNGWIALKHSGLIIQMANTVNTYKDGRFLEKIGIAPNIKVPAGKDAMDFAIADYFTHNN